MIPGSEGCTAWACVFRVGDHLKRLAHQVAVLGVRSVRNLEDVRARGQAVGLLFKAPADGVILATAQGDVGQAMNEVGPLRVCFAAACHSD